MPHVQRANEGAPEDIVNDAPITPLPDDAPAIKRIFLRLRSGGSGLNELEISNIFLAQAGLPPLESFSTPHYIHGGDGGFEKVYHIILDINHAVAPPDIKIQDIPHELYRVHFNENRTEPKFERLYGGWLRITMLYSNLYWWGMHNVGSAP